MAVKRSTDSNFDFYYGEFNIRRLLTYPKNQYKWNATLKICCYKSDFFWNRPCVCNIFSLQRRGNSSAGLHSHIHKHRYCCFLIAFNSWVRSKRLQVYDTCTARFFLFIFNVLGMLVCVSTSVITSDKFKKIDRYKILFNDSSFQYSKFAIIPIKKLSIMFLNKTGLILE